MLWHEKKFSFHFIFIMKFWTYHVHNMKIKTNIVAHNKISVVVSTSLLQNTWKLHHRVILAQDYLGRHFAASIWFSQKLLFWQNLCVTLIIISTKVFYPSMKLILWEYKNTFFKYEKIFCNMNIILLKYEIRRNILKNISRM